MLPTLSYIIFKHRVNKRGEVNIYLRITIDRKSTYISTKIAVPFKYWDEKKQKVKAGFKLANITNMLLEKKMAENRENLMKLAMKEKLYSAKIIKAKVISKSEVTFFGLADEYVNGLRRDGKIGSVDKITTIFKKFEEFLGSRSIKFYEIDTPLLNDYIIHLKEKLNNRLNTVHTNLKQIKRIFNLAMKQDIIGPELDPFRKIELKSEKTFRPFLTEDEFHQISDLKLPVNSFIEKCRDIFIWTIYAGGLRVSDVILLQKCNIEGSFLNIIIRKTKTAHRIKLSEKAISIMQPYINICSLPTDYVFGLVDITANVADPVKLDRVISKATMLYNLELKEIAKMAKINKNLSSHIARITFTTLAVKKGIDMRTVQGVLKHSDLEMTAHYSKLVDTSLDEALEKFQNSI